MKSDKEYMKRCEELAKVAGEKGNVPVGSVIVKECEIIAEAEEAGKTKNDITCHAEIEVVRAAVKNLGSKDLSGCTLYTTHEPCVMCSYAIRFHRISKVVYLHPVEYLGGITSSMPVLTTDEVPAHWGKAPEIVRFSEG